MRPPGITIAVFLTSLFAATSFAFEPLAPRIDQLIDAALIAPPAAVTNDAEFLRRVCLDLNGVIPSSSEARSFLDDATPNKRELLIDRLLASPRFATHMARVFDVMLMERRPDKHVAANEWYQYLQTTFVNNKPYDQLAREILGADGTDPNLRPAAKFFLDRDAEPHVMARDVGRIFFGMDLQCAQCHDHPLVDHYLQTDYYGLFAFVNRTTVFTDANLKKSFLGEKSDGDASYKSVFTQDAGQIRPQLPGENQIDEPRFRQGEDYVAAPLPNVRPVPKYSRRARLAELATNGSNRQFNLNIANRLWAHMMGRGLVHPVDLHHPLNPPSHPDVLDLMANELVANKFNLQWLLRELALTRTYQRSIDPPAADFTAQLAAAAAQAPAITAEYAALKMEADESRKLVDAAQTEFKAGRSGLATVETALRTAEAAVTAAKKPLDDAQANVAKSQNEAATKQMALTAINEATGKSADVVKLLPNDKELAAALATFTAKQKQLTGELETVQKKIAEQSAALPALQSKLVEAYPPADTAYTAYVDARKPVDDAKVRLIATWNQHKSKSLVAMIRKKRVDRTQAHLNWQAAVAKVASSRGTIEAQKKSLAEAQQSVDQQQVEVTKHTAVASEMEKASIEASRLLDEAKSQYAAKQTVVQAVNEAVAKTDAALQKLPSDPELTAAAQKLKERLEPLQKEAATLEQAVTGRDAAAKEAANKFTAASQAKAAATAEMTSRQQRVTAITSDVNQAIVSLQSAEADVATGRSGLVELWTNDAAVRVLKQVSPEQLGWNVIQATGILDSQIVAADAEVEKSIAKASVINDATQKRARDVKVEQQLDQQMRGHVGPFVNLYAASAGQPQEDFFATPDQALFVANGGTVVGWAAGGQLAQRLSPLMDANAFAEELYLATLTRRPTEVEIKESTEYLAAHAAERPQAIRDLIWSLLTSAEFRFNH